MSTTSADPRTVNIPRGETFLDVDFGNVRTTSAPAAPPVGAPGSGATAPVPSVPAAPSPAAAPVVADGPRTDSPPPSAAATDATTGAVAPAQTAAAPEDPFALDPIVV